MPLLSHELPISADVLITGVQRYIFVILLMLPFEIRDLKFDNLKLSTIPQKIGVKQTKIIGVALILSVFLLEFFKDEITVNGIIVLLVVLLVTLLFLLYSNPYLPSCLSYCILINRCFHCFCVLCIFIFAQLIKFPRHFRIMRCGVLE